MSRKLLETEVMVEEEEGESDEESGDRQMSAMRRLLMSSSSLSVSLSMESLEEIGVDEEEDEEEGDEMDTESSHVEYSIAWKSQVYSVRLHEEATVQQLQEKLEASTGVQAHRQKLIGLRIKGKDTHVSLRTACRGKTSFKMVGTRDENVAKDPRQVENVPRVVNDFVPTLWQVENEPEWQAALQEHIERVEVRLLNEPRAGKKLLVLDVDYTLYDMKSQAEEFETLQRPYLHRFLAAAYEHFDIVIWSQTSRAWLRAKLVALGMHNEGGASSNAPYKLCCVLDKSSMFKIESDYRRKRMGVHAIKPLQLLWSKFPKLWDATNTIHVDDYAPNFALNPGNGLKVHAFRNAVSTASTDNELLMLGIYLAQIADVEDVCTLDLERWRDDAMDEFYG